MPQAKGTVIGSMMVMNDKAMEIYKYSEGGFRSYADTINAFEEKLERHAKVYSLLAPTQIEFIQNERCRVISDSQKKAIDFVNNKFNSNIIPIKAYETIQH